MTRYQRNKREMLRKRALAWVEGRERKRLARASADYEIGRVVFSGRMFGGHVLRAFVTDEEDAPPILEIDGQVFDHRTKRGILRLLAARLMRNVRSDAGKSG